MTEAEVSSSGGATATTTYDRGEVVLVVHGQAGAGDHA
jgi:hypothetical protein